MCIEHDFETSGVVIHLNKISLKVTYLATRVTSRTGNCLGKCIPSFSRVSSARFSSIPCIPVPSLGAYKTPVISVRTGIQANFNFFLTREILIGGDCVQRTHVK